MPKKPHLPKLTFTSYNSFVTEVFYSARYFQHGDGEGNCIPKMLVLEYMVFHFVFLYFCTSGFINLGFEFLNHLNILFEFSSFPAKIFTWFTRFDNHRGFFRSKTISIAKTEVSGI